MPIYISWQVIFEKFVSLLTESSFWNLCSSQVFSEHLIAIFRECVSANVSHRGVTWEELQGDGWDLHSLAAWSLFRVSQFLWIRMTSYFSPMSVILSLQYSHIVWNPLNVLLYGWYILWHPVVVCSFSLVSNVLAVSPMYFSLQWSQVISYTTPHCWSSLLPFWVN